MENQDRAPGTDAVCFTAGPQGIPFSAGVIHAWLASDRAQPQVIAGISAGALSGAALARACQELAQAGALLPAAREARRWNWFRQYLDAITNQPLKPIWDAIPDPDDYFADKPPVKDLSVAQLPGKLPRTEARSRQHYYRLVKLGLWMAGLRVSVAEVATCAVRWVRYQERYALWPLQRALLWGRLAVIAGKVLLHLGLSPQFTIERVKFLNLPYPRPVFGPIWFVPVLLVADLAYGIIKLAGVLALWASQHAYLSPLLAFLRRQLNQRVPYADALLSWISRYFVFNYLPWLPVVGLIVGAVAAAVIFFMVLFHNWTIGFLAKQLGIHRALFDSYTLRRKLFELFNDAGQDVFVPPKLLLVAAPLQKFENGFGKQVWFESGVTPLVEALLASLAIPGLFAPVKAEPGWIAGQKKGETLDLIDGAQVRQNPLPALFRWLKKSDQKSVRDILHGSHRGDAAVHLVYGVPIRPSDQPDRREHVDLVDEANIGIDLARRRDSRMEFRQTNFISEMALRVQNAGGEPHGIYPIFADEIAPAREIAFENYLDPTRDELLKVTAAGCRSTLETLYRHRLAAFGYQPVPCSTFLSQLAPRRAGSVEISAPGLPEVCRRCTKMLWPLPDPVAEAKKHSERWFERIPLTQYSHLAPDDGAPNSPAPHRPRIVFLAAGGVFRGAFHIGVIGAMQVARMQPDLIVGASVGTLMGGALGAISALPDDGARQKLLGELCLTFLEVDRRVALTKVLKNAAKQLGTRGRAVHLSPADIRRAVRRGTRSDPGFAVAGAPSVLIDAISTLFLIPHKDTGDIAAQFVAGRITEALKRFWQAARNETLQRLDITSAIIGTSLLEDRARTLLGSDRFHLDRDQPYAGISLFATASDISRSQPLLLPRDLDHSTVYDFVQAGLSSSAFPAAFRPRQQAEVQPGCGATDILYADGGMFDNLPFFPAIEVLSVVQRNWRTLTHRPAADYLDERLQRPDLFLSASLEAQLGDSDAGDRLDSFLAIHQRAAKLSVNTKLNSFVDNAAIVAANGRLLHQAYAASAAVPPDDVAEFMDSVVNAAVLQVTPTDKDHLNGTFAFSRSVGFSPWNVAKSIADGCFRTQRSLIRPAPNLAATAVAQMQAAGRIAGLSVNSNGQAGQPDGCPFFRREKNGNPAPFLCPFAEAAERFTLPESGILRIVYQQCVSDEKHLSSK